MSTDQWAATSNQGTSNEIQKLRHDVMTIKNDLKVLNERMDFQLRMERLDFALKNVELNSFNYYDKEHKKVNSSVLVRNIIFWWRRGVNAVSSVFCRLSSIIWSVWYIRVPRYGYRKDENDVILLKLPLTISKLNLLHISSSYFCFASAPHFNRTLAP